MNNENQDQAGAGDTKHEHELQTVRAALFTDDMNDEAVELLHGITEKGHRVVIGVSNREQETPFVRINGKREIFGAAAIRAYFQLQS